MSSIAENRKRVGAGVATVAVEGLIACALIFGMAVDIPAKMNRDLKIFNVREVPAPPPKVEKIAPRQAKRVAAKSASSPPALKANPAEILAVQVPPVLAPTVVAAATPGSGNSPSAGASSVDGPGSGNGGAGTGLGDGNGNGGGGETMPRWRSGRIKNSDYPQSAWNAGVGGTVSVRYVVAPTGHATGCTVVRSSGNSSLDTTTCELIEQRFRFVPSKDAQGRPIPSLVSEDHDWSAT
jgi:protein TonB